MPEHPCIPIICGPTASGKTSVALRVAESVNIEIVSADSRQIIRHLNIGTAKPTAAGQAAVPMHLIDLIEPGERYSAFRFVDDATVAIRSIIGRGNHPLVVGGTGLYLRALSEGVVEIDESDMSIRENLEQECAEKGSAALHERLQAVDPLEAAKVHPNNEVRIVRALEIYLLTGKSKSELVATGSYKRAAYPFQYFCLDLERSRLYETINDRVDAMLEAGLVTELQALLDAGMGPAVRRANVIGYRELMDSLEGSCTLAEATALIKQNTRRFAKRQMTWFRRQEGVQFYSDPEDLTEAVSKMLRGSSKEHN